jgi:uncharacterized protein (TIGR04141 family)
MPKKDKAAPNSPKRPRNRLAEARVAVRDVPSTPEGLEGGRKPPDLPGATFYRLRADLAGNAVAIPAVFLTNPELLMGEAEIQGGRAFLYGRAPISDPPDFVPFIKQQFEVEIPDSHRLEYVLVIRGDGKPKSWYALAFGIGRYLLKEEYLDVDGAREVARRQTMTQKPGVAARLNQLRTKQPCLANTITTEKRANRPATLDELDFDPYTSVLDAASGAPHDSVKFGSRLTGGTGIKVRKNLSIDDLASMATNLESAYLDAVQNASVIGIRIVHNQALISQLDQQLLDLLKDENETDRIAFSLPYFEDAEDNPSLTFTKMGQDVGSYADDLDVRGYRNALRDSGKWDGLSVEFLKTSAAVIGGGKRRFKIYQCLSVVVELDGKTYVHDERSWYVVPSEAKEYIDETIRAIPFWEGLPDALQRVEERDYNANVGVGEYLLLDRKNLSVIAGEDPIEICDLLTVENKKLSFIHVKRDFSSSTLSHLFAQGRVSASLLQQRALRDLMFAHILREARRRQPQPPWSRRLRGYLEHFQCNRIRIVYAIMGDWGNAGAAERIPFFSKVNLIREVRNLRGRDFEVCLGRIQMPGPVYAKRKKERKPKAPGASLSSE